MYMFNIIYRYIYIIDNTRILLSLFSIAEVVFGLTAFNVSYTHIQLYDDR